MIWWTLFHLQNSSMTCSSISYILVTKTFNRPKKNVSPPNYNNIYKGKKSYSDNKDDIQITWNNSRKKQTRTLSRPTKKTQRKRERERERGTYRVIFTKWSFSSLFSSSMNSKSALNLLSISLRSSNRLLIRFVRFNFVFLSSSFSWASFANSALRICNSLS